MVGRYRYAPMGCGVVTRALLVLILGVVVVTSASDQGSYRTSELTGKKEQVVCRLVNSCRTLIGALLPRQCSLGCLVAVWWWCVHLRPQS